MTRYAIENGGIVNLVEYPGVAKNQCRWRLQVMADHSADQISRFTKIAVAARTSAAALVG
jgi:glycine C-acetyltransferase